jgi:hypothetical protein
MPSSATCAGPAAHPGGDEDHIGAVDHLVEVITRLFGRFGADGRVAARAQSLGQLVADSHAVWRTGKHQCLGIGIDGDKLNAPQTLFDHAVDGVAATPTHTQHLDPCEIFHVWHRLSLHVSSSR